MPVTNVKTQWVDGNLNFLDVSGNIIATWDGTNRKLTSMAGTVLDTEAAGTVLAFAFTNTATKKIIATCTAAVGDATGGCSITVLAIPTT